MGKIMAGAAKVKITPPQEMMPAHYHGNIVFEGVYQDIYVRSLVLDNGERKIAMIAYESGDVSRTADLLNALKEECGLEPENVQFSAVHSHEAPTFSNEHWRMKGNPEKLAWVIRYGDFIIRQTVNCVKNAIECMRPASYGLGVGKSYINVCRDELFENGLWDQGRNFEGPSDKELMVLKVTDKENRLIAVLLNYAVHGTACYQGKDAQGEKYLIAGDIPGMISRYLEERYSRDKTVFLWTSGAAGNQNPIFFSAYQQYHHDKSHSLSFDLGYQKWMLAEHLAEVQAMDVIRILGRIQRMKQDMRITVVEKNLSLPGQKVRYDEASSSPMERAGKPFCGIIEAGEPVVLRLKLMTLDDIGILGLNGELCTEIGLRIKECSPLKRTFIITHTAERVGYLPSKEGYDNHTLEFYASSVKDGCTEEYLLPAVLEMFEERLRK